MQIRKAQDAASFDSNAPARDSFFEGAHCRTTVWYLEAGQEIHPHAHAGDHVWTVIEGEGWVLSGNGAVPQAVERGSVAFAPAGEPHGMRAGTRMIFVSVSAG
jgi:quercetin dioxygenase-like cupin family protein